MFIYTLASTFRFLVTCTMPFDNVDNVHDERYGRQADDTPTLSSLSVHAAWRRHDVVWAR